MSPALLQATLAFCLTLFCIWALTPVAMWCGLVDAPNHRKQHAGSIPLIGGIAIYVALLVAALVWGQTQGKAQGLETHVINTFLAAGGMLVLLGVLDDRFHLSVFTRVLAEVAVALFLIESLDLRLASLGDLLGVGKVRLSDWLSYPFTVLVIFVVINAYNMLDGMDGLLGIIVLITIFAFHLLTGLPPGLITIVISAALVAFLISNLGLAPSIPKTFLGDAGSKLLGFIVVALTLSVTSQQVGQVRYVQPITAVYLLGLPMFDMAFTTLRRLFSGKSPVRADNTHIHHLLRELGLSDKRALLLIGSAGVSIPFLGLMLARANTPESYQFSILIGAFLMYCILMSQAWHIARKRTAPAETNRATIEDSSVDKT
ncbi:MAG: MraY family glycosyltransferase [Haliea sp.]|uniref:MraY family glycosyltransferase n=1 Tax=Haliea sp. TaxID=1932666 RepID=UPI0032ED05E8